MKKMPVLVLTLILAASLSACQVNPAADINSASSQDNTSSAPSIVVDSSEPAAENALHSLKIGNTNGRYATSYQVDHTILCYIDYPSATDTALCAQPACNHDSESCTAYIPGGAIVSSICLVDDQTIAFIVSENQGSTIYLADSNGSNRRKIYQTASGEDIWELTCADENSLYFPVSIAQDDGSVETMYRIPLSGGEPESVFDLSGCQILGADGRKLVCYEYEYNEPENAQQPEIPEGATQEEIDQLYIEYQSGLVGTHRVYLHDIDTGAEQDLDNWTSAMGNEGRLVTWQDGNLYWCENGWNQLPDSMHWMAADGQDHQVAISWPEDVVKDVQSDENENSCVDRLEMIVQNRALLVVHGPWEDFRRYAVDLSDGSVAEIPLQYQSNGKEKPVAILGQSTDSLLVEMETQMEDVTYIQQDGTPTTNSSVTNRYALITFPDFFAGKPNYREIQAQYVQSIW